MKYLILFCLSIIGIEQSYSQNFEIGTIAGGINYIGDVGNSNFIAPNAPYGGIIAKWNRSSRYAIRGSIAAAQIIGDDSKSDDLRRQDRGLYFNGSSVFATIGIEYNFWEFNLNEINGFAATPYLFLGFTYFSQDQFIKIGNHLVKNDIAWEIAIPMVLGIKSPISRSFLIALEIGPRFTITDNMDGSFPTNQDLDLDKFRFGNQNNNDWYMISAVTLTYTFGRKSCDCPF